MFTSKPKKLTDFSRVFLEPSNATHRQYEALRAFFVEGLPSAEAARRFGYTPGASASSSTNSARVPHGTSSSLRPRDPSPHPRPIPSATASSPSVNRTSPSTTSAAIWPTKDTLSARSPSPGSSRTKDSLACRPGRRRTPTRLAAHHGRCRRCPATRSEPALFETQFGGLFLFLPMLSAIPLDRILQKSGFPGSEMIPTQLRPAIALGLEAVRDGSPPPCHERGPGPGAGPLRRFERHPQAIVLDGNSSGSTRSAIQSSCAAGSTPWAGSVCPAVIPSTWTSTQSPSMARMP